MLLIYVPKITNRLGYTLKVVMKHLLQVEYAITTNEEAFLRHQDAKISYGNQRIGDAPYIKAVKLLFETTVEDQDPHCLDYQGYKALFPVFGKDVDLPFDPLAAIFYMLSRYEEYLPHHCDEHGRFVSSESLAVREGFIQTAVVDRWALAVRDLILSSYPNMVFPGREYQFLQTVDIDAAYCYRGKELGRTVLGMAKDIFVRHDVEAVHRRLRILRGKETDPFDTFDYILDIKRRSSGFSMVTFPLLGDYSIYDKPISWRNREFRELLQRVGDDSRMGIHASYGTLEEPKRIETEKQRLADVLHRPVVRNRFHFLRLELPKSYRQLLKYGISHDYSMGYADVPGYRCGTATPHPFYGLSRDLETDLMVHPFVVMDTTLQKYMNLTPEDALVQYKALIDEARAVGGVFCFIIHNQNLCESFGWEGWRKTYESMVEYGTR